MRFNIENKPDYRESWHIWFAWHPVKIENQRVWLEKVKRIGTCYQTDLDSIWLFKYNLLNRRE